MSTRLEVRFGGHSIEGIKPVNQDAFAAHLPDGSERDLKGAAAVMCDGVSSAADSEIASQYTVSSGMAMFSMSPIMICSARGSAG
ncbi:MAG: hypothetical protein KDF61_16260 [Rhodocyclaceae bacterium]|nr:hypothetical protein [Rhodocyclaceae bacterium]